MRNLLFKIIILVIVAMLLFAACSQKANEMPTPEIQDNNQTIEKQEDVAKMSEQSDRIHVNQLGYLENGKKRFWVTGECEAFNIISTKTSEIVYSGNMVMIGSDDAIDDITGYGDFSSVSVEGEYYVEVDGDFRSYDFSIKDKVYDDLSSSVLKMLYYQRCGVELTEEYAGDYAHKACHTDLGYKYGSDEEVDGIGGWHDAGDYGRYTVPAVRTIADLLFAYQLYPTKFSDNTNIPESGNGVADILDEAKVGLDWLFKMQDAETGGVYHKYTSTSFCGMVMPQLDFLTCYAIRISPTATGSFAAIMAKSHMIYKDIDLDYSQKCLEAAIKAYDFLMENPDLPLYENPEDVTTGDYKDLSYVDEKYWAAIELYLVTSNTTYLEHAKKLYSPHTALLWSDTLEWYDVGFLGTFSYLLSNEADKTDPFYETLKGDTIKAADDLVELSTKRAFSVAMTQDDYIWGSNMVLTNRANVLILANKINPNNAYLEVVQSHVDYLLGCNILSQCYITGYGEKSIKFPHHRPSIADGVKTPIPGMVSGGPNAALQDNVAVSNFDKNTPPAKCFKDESAAYSLNEVTTYWNSSALFSLCGLMYMD